MVSKRYLSLTLWAVLGVAFAGCDSQQLEKIRISKDGRGFETSSGKPFVPCGINYFRPGTGWAPQVWKQFDPDATRADFARMKAMGLNCARVFISYGSFYREPGVVDPEGLAKFDQFLTLAENAGIYVHPTGPDHWEGLPNWRPVGVEDNATVKALEDFWKIFAARYRGRNVIFAYDLKNEPEVGWKTEALQAKWGRWLQNTNVPVPADAEVADNPKLPDYQTFRELCAAEWTRRQVAAIKAADPDALVTVGLIQWSVPSLLPAGPRHYSAFNPHGQAQFLDFLEIHFYPLENGIFQYQNEEEEARNLSYLEGILREVARAGKPVVLAEFGWYGGGQPTFNTNLLAASESQHAAFCKRMLETSEGWVAGWLNWGFYDHPQARDCTELTGLLTADGRMKEWGRVFAEWAKTHKDKRITPPQIGPRPNLDWAECVSSRKAGDEFRNAYLEAWRKQKDEQETGRGRGPD